MRGIILREDADALVVRPTEADLQRFGLGTAVEVGLHAYREVSLSAQSPQGDDLAPPGRYYGSRSPHFPGVAIDVEVALTARGYEVCSLWYRCAALPYTLTVVEDDRRVEMARLVQSGLPGIAGVQLVDAHRIVSDRTLSRFGVPR